MSEVRNKVELDREKRENIVHSAMYGVKDYIGGVAQADMVSMLAALMKLHREGVLTEGQVSRATRIDRVAIRELADRIEERTSIETAPTEVRKQAGDVS